MPGCGSRGAAVHRSPSDKEPLDRIGALFGIEHSIRGKPHDERRQCREEHAAPRLADLKAWLKANLTKLTAKTDLAADMRYGLWH